MPGREQEKGLPNYSAKSGRLRGPVTLLALVMLLVHGLLLPLPAVGEPPAAKQVLVVHSYHHGFPWTDTVSAAIRDTLHEEYPQAEIHEEYLDANRFPLDRSLSPFKELLRLKYGEKLPDIVLTSDDDAFRTMLQLRDELLEEVPLVFCGVNHLDDRLLQIHGSITGTVEDFDLKKTVEVALALQPTATKLAVISDSTLTGRINLERFRQIRPNLPGRLEGVVELADLSEDELFDGLAELDKETIILLLSFFRDRNDKAISIKEIMARIKSACNLPVYVAWDSMLGHGAVGGRVVSARQQGETAAHLATLVLQGESAASIPILRTSPNLFMFDRKALDRFGIDRLTLPQGSVVINDTPSLFKEYIWQVIVITALFLAETLLILTLVFALRRLTATKRALLVSQERFLLAMQASQDGLFDWNLACNEVYFSPGWKQMLGYRDEELENNLGVWKRLTHEGDVDRVNQALQAYLAGQDERFEVEFKMLHKDGHWVDILARANIHYDDAGQPVRVVGTHVDLTRRKQVEMELRESEERFRSLCNASFGGIAIHDHGRILECNHGLADLTGYKEEELIGMDCMHLFAEQSREAVKHYILSGYEEPYEEYGLRKNGEEFPLHVHAKNVRYKGKMVRTAEFIDITERKKIELERQCLERQLIQAHKMEAIGTLAGGIAHDFNNMLGAILGYADMAKEDADNPELAHSLDKILEAGNRARDLVRQILTFSRQTGIAPIPVEPVAIVHEATTMLRSILPATIDLRVNIARGVKRILADPTQFHQVVTNLCTNAFHAMERTGGVVHISLVNTLLQPDDLDAFPHCHPGPYVCLSVADTGPGIPSSIRDRIFEPFFTTKAIGQGTGMGLAMVHGIIKRYGGFIRCNSTPGQGATLLAFLPAITQHGQTPDVPLEPVAASRGNILLVDDEAILVEMSKAMLERRGYSVTGCTSGSEALVLVERDPDRFDAVLTDQIMPQMTGIELARKLLILRPGLPVILCTGYSNLVNEEQAKACGLKGFLMKPLAMNQVVELLQKVVGTS